VPIVGLGSGDLLNLNFLTSSQDDILEDMYSEHNCFPLAASASVGLGRHKFDKEQKRRTRDRRRCQDAFGWFAKAVESGAVMETEGEAVRAAWAFVPLLVKLLWPSIAQMLIQWLWNRTR
jgi:hypothetical protein